MHGSVETLDTELALPQRRRRRFMVWIAGIAVALVLGGFAKTFYLRPLFLDLPLPSLAMVHGLAMSSWVALFIAQVALVAGGKIRWHRRLGVAGMLLAPLLLVLGLGMAVAAMRAGHTPVPQVTPQQFLAVPVFTIVVFASVAGAGLMLRRRPELHRRLMLLAMLSILPPAIARIPQALDVFRAGSLFLAIGVTAMLVVVCAVRDARCNHCLHPVYVLAGVPVILALPLALLVSHTTWWQHLADLLT